MESTCTASAPLSNLFLPNLSREDLPPGPNLELSAHFRDRKARSQAHLTSFQCRPTLLSGSLERHRWKVGRLGSAFSARKGALKPTDGRHRIPPGHRARCLGPGASRPLQPRVLPPCPGSGNCGFGPAWVPESAMAAAAAETRVFLEVRRRLQSALLILG